MKNQNPIHWFQHDLHHIRQTLANGQPFDGCRECYQMEQHGKVSGRQRQLLKIGVTQQAFQKTMLSSPWLKQFIKTNEYDHTTQWPQDWQIDLGNFCNSACVFCAPIDSSRLAAEYKKLGLISTLPPNSWCDDPELLASFVDTLTQSPRLAYLHFIGGETLLTPAFKKILSALVDHGLNTKASIGFTTNLTVWDEETIDLLCKFQEINLGMSIECVHPLNDYVRYGGNLGKTIEILEKWLMIAKDNRWLMQLRITPSVLSIWHLDTVYQYARNKKLAIESCNFLSTPEFMKPSVLPRKYRLQVIDKLEKFLSQLPECKDEPVLNSRNPNLAVNQNRHDAESYIKYLQTEPDESHRLPDLVAYLKKLESNRGNNILDYLPEYEQFLRTAGY